MCGVLSRKTTRKTGYMGGIPCKQMEKIQVSQEKGLKTGNISHSNTDITGENMHVNRPHYEREYRVKNKPTALLIHSVIQVVILLSTTYNVIIQLYDHIVTIINEF